MDLRKTRALQCDIEGVRFIFSDTFTVALAWTYKLQLILREVEMLPQPRQQVGVTKQQGAGRCIELTDEQRAKAYRWLKYGCFEVGYITNKELLSRIKDFEAAEPHPQLRTALLHGRNHT